MRYDLRHTPNREPKDTEESLLAKLRPRSEWECMNLIRDCRLPGRARTVREMPAEARRQSGAPKLSDHDIRDWSGLNRIPAT